MNSCMSEANEIKTKNTSDHFIDGKFVNTDPNGRYTLSLSKIFSGFKKYYFEKSEDSKPKSPDQIPVIKHSKESIFALQDYSVLRLTHSTLLLKIGGKFWITDPVFSDDISPMILSNERFHDLPITIDDLPELEGVLISHNHYDHFDKESIKKFRDKVNKFFVPLGLADALTRLGIKADKIIELDWWQSVQHEQFKLVATPAQHFSGRGLFDGGDTLWCSWVLISPKAKIFFSGDSGYFKGFKEIGEKYGPFDMTFIEAGAYNEDWKEMHLLPNDSIQAHIDLKGKIMFPIHNSSFDMALHSWYEPLEIISSAANEKGVTITHPKMGEVVPIQEYAETNKWWRPNYKNIDK